MSSVPPSGPPTGPPSGPLSGPSPGPSGPRAPWWRTPRGAVIILGAAVLVLAIALAFTQLTATTATSEVLQSAATTGQDPFTPSVAAATPPSATASPTPLPPPSPSGAAGTSTVQGSTPGLYGGTMKASSCNVAQLTSLLTSHPDKGRAFAAVEGIAPDSLPGFLRSLTPVLLRADTRVTNHGFKDGAATRFTSVLQAGTAVLVDSRGVPRVRCACGNPLLPPPAARGEVKYTGQAWAAFQPSRIIVVVPAPQPMSVITLYDVGRAAWFERPVGHDGGNDQPTTPPTSRPSGPAATGPSSSAPSSSPAVTGPSPSPPSTLPTGGPPSSAPQPSSTSPPSPPASAPTPSPQPSSATP